MPAQPGLLKSSYSLYYLEHLRPGTCFLQAVLLRYPTFDPPITVRCRVCLTKNDQVLICVISFLAYFGGILSLFTELSDASCILLLFRYVT